MTSPRRRGQSYATILIDMDTHQPIDVLEDRQAGTLAQWLKDHPGVQVICRDRAGAYAEGAREGAPDAIQVADRFHLWQNLCDAVEKTVISCRADLREPAPEPGDPEPAGPGSDVPAETTGHADGQDAGHGRLATRSRERHAAIHDLLAQGRNYTQISEMLGLTRHTVRKFARAATAEQVITGPSPRSSRLDRFAPYLQQRWNQGCTDAAQLFTEIQAQGYSGSTRSARRYLQPLRATLTAPVLPPPPPTVREVTRWITSHPDHLTDDENSPAQPGQSPQPAAERRRRPRHRIRRDDDRPPRRAPARLDRRRRPRQPAPPALLHQRHPPRPGRRHQRPHPRAQQRRSRRQRLPHQSHQTPDVWPRQPRPAPERILLST